MVEGIMSYNKDALIVASSLACLEIRSRNEEAINSTWNRIYSLKVSTYNCIDVECFSYFLFVSELI